MADDFEPVTDTPDQISDDDSPVISTAQARDQHIQRRRRRLVELLLVVGGGILLLSGQPVFRVVVAVAIMYLLLRLGFAIIGSFARPMPEPPPPGELRKVKLVYRCVACGTQLRMTLANDQDPSPPRHCANEMDLITPVEL